MLRNFLRSPLGGTFTVPILFAVSLSLVPVTDGTALDLTRSAIQYAVVTAAIATVISSGARRASRIAFVVIFCAMLVISFDIGLQIMLEARSHCTLNVGLVEFFGVWTFFQAFFVTPLDFIVQLCAGSVTALIIERICNLVKLRAIWFCCAAIAITAAAFLGTVEGMNVSSIKCFDL